MQKSRRNAAKEPQKKVVMVDQTQRQNDNAVETYCEVLSTAFIIQNKVYQLQDIIAEVKEKNNLPRAIIAALKCSQNHQNKKKVQVEFQTNSNIPRVINSVFNPETINHLQQATLKILTYYQSIAQFVQALPIPEINVFSPCIESNLQEDLEQQVKAFYEQQQAYLEFIPSLNKQLKDDIFLKIADLVNLVLESTRPNTDSAGIQRAIADFNQSIQETLLPQAQYLDRKRQSLSALYEIQQEFVSPLDKISDDSVKVQKILIPGLTKPRFLKFAGQTELYRPTRLMQLEQREQLLKSAFPDLLTILNQESEQIEQIEALLSSYRIKQKRQEEQIQAISAQEGQEEQKQEETNDQDLKQFVENINIEFQTFVRWRNILFSTANGLYFTQGRQVTLDDVLAIETVQEWHDLLNTPYLQLIRDQIGFTLDRCIRLICQLPNKELAVYCNTGKECAKQRLTALPCQKTLGILIFSSPRILHQLQSVYSLIDYLFKIDALLSVESGSPTERVSESDASIVQITEGGELSSLIN